MAGPKMLGGKCGCPYCKDGVLNPNWKSRSNKRGHTFGKGKKQ